ncbi:MAG: hypothetical protein B6D55_08315 [Candidatus Omnitrophica bacterium 4484_70.2]|nr:MAG: hypothetical protein B6D55_08315 [Candidatus Omnitrophica bacterium 4484_70.2]
MGFKEMNKGIKYFLKNRSLLCLWTGQVISQFGDRINQMALIGLIYSKFGASVWELSKIFSFVILPVFLISPVAGIYVDRWSKKYTMFFADVLRGILVIILALYLIKLNTLIPVYGAVFLIFCIARFFVPAKMSIIPKIVNRENLNFANSLISTTGMIAAILGFGIGGIIVEKLGPQKSFIIDGFTFLVSGVLIMFIKEKQKAYFSGKEFMRLAKGVVENVKRTLKEDIKQTLLYIFKDKEGSFIFKNMFILFGILGALYPTIIVFVQKKLGSQTKDIGILAISMGLGLFVSSLIYGRWGGKEVIKTVYWMLFSGSLVLLSFVLFIEKIASIKVALFLSFILGNCIGPIIVGTTTLIHRTCSSQLHGKVFSSLEIAIHFSFIISMFIAASVSNLIGVLYFLIILSIIITLYSLTGILNGYKSRAL